MEYQVIDMDDTAFVLINFPLVFFTTTANIFFGCCLIFSRQRIKQPLRTLLGLIVSCSIFYCMSLTVSYLMKNTTTTFIGLVVSYLIAEHFVNSSMTCCAWLSFYYYVHVVPPQRPLLIWMKRNIKSVISVAVPAGMMLHSSNGAINAAVIFHRPNSNGTFGFIEMYYTSQFFFYFQQLYISVCVYILMFSSFSTVHYLQTHMRRILQSGNRLTPPKIQSQMRVAVTGTLQGLLFIFYYTFYLTHLFFLVAPSDFYLSDWVALTATMLYFSFSTVNMGIGQATIRQSAADVLKALRALCIVGMVTNDVKLHSNQQMSGEISNPITGAERLP